MASTAPTSTAASTGATTSSAAAANSTAAAATGDRVVRIESEPAGASVSEDGKELCSPTPCDVTFKGEGGAAAKEHKLSLNKKGFKTGSVAVAPTDAKASGKLDGWGGGGSSVPGPAAAPVSAPKFDGCLDNSDCKGGKSCVHGWCK